MPWTITRLCIDCIDTGCVSVCPVDCIYEYVGDDRETFPNMLYIHPDECIDCGACEPECPWQAIFEEPAVPEIFARRYRSEPQDRRYGRSIQGQNLSDDRAPHSRTDRRQQGEMGLDRGLDQRASRSPLNEKWAARVVRPPITLYATAYAGRRPARHGDDSAPPIPRRPGLASAAGIPIHELIRHLRPLSSNPDLKPGSAQPRSFAARTGFICPKPLDYAFLPVLEAALLAQRQIFILPLS